MKDGKAGFPAHFLEAASELGVELKLVAGELYVRTVNAMLGTDQDAGLARPALEWRPTGDQVEQIGDRCYFLGRRSDHINVGGNKGPTSACVEQVIQTVPAFATFRSSAGWSSLVGEMVACEFFVEPGFDP